MLVLEAAVSVSAGAVLVPPRSCWNNEDACDRECSYACVSVAVHLV
jgi:hypothetical protein